jgi:hypothetical protein
VTQSTVVLVLSWHDSGAVYVVFTGVSLIREYSNTTEGYEHDHLTGAEHHPPLQLDPGHLET